MEAEFLKDWIERNAEFVGLYPFDKIYGQLTNILRDGFIDQDESADLHDTLARFVGGEAFSNTGQTASRSTTLPVDDPEPLIVYEGAMFVVTGTFSHGQRSAVHAVIENRGGLIGASPSKKTRFLVIGELGSRDWINSNAGQRSKRQCNYGEKVIRSQSYARRIGAGASEFPGRRMFIRNKAPSAAANTSGRPHLRTSL